jgi:hypothetical protein
MLHIPRVGNALFVALLDAICGWADDFGDDEGSFPSGKKLMHAVGLLDASENWVADVEGGLLDVAIVVPTELLAVTSLPHDSSHSMFFEAIEVDTMSLLGFSLFIELYAWSSECNVGR